MNDVD